MANSNFLKALSVFAANQGKLHLENVYDRAGQTDTMKRLKTLPSGQKYSIATGLNLLSTFFEQNFPEGTALQTFIKKIGEDVGPELGKRIVNGTPQEQDIYNIFLSMEKDDLVALLEWLEKTPIQEREAVIQRMAKLEPEEIANLVSLSPEQFNLFRSLFWKEKAQTDGPPLDLVQSLSDGLRRIFLKDTKKRLRLKK